jgi:hypothetical protein
LARLIPLLMITLMLPVSPTRPDALNMPLAEATCPFSIEIGKLAPLGQLGRFDDIWTFQWPSYPVDARAGEPEIIAAARMTRLIEIALLKFIAASHG